MASEQKASAIYSAVHNRMMDLRVALRMKLPGLPREVDDMVARAMDDAASAAEKAYRTPLSAPKGGA